MFVAAHRSPCLETACTTHTVWFVMQLCTRGRGVADALPLVSRPDVGVAAIGQRDRNYVVLLSLRHGVADFAGAHLKAGSLLHHRAARIQRGACVLPRAERVLGSEHSHATAVQAHARAAAEQREVGAPALEERGRFHEVGAW